MSRTWILTPAALAAVLADSTAKSVVDATGNTIYELVQNLTDNVTPGVTTARHVATFSYKDIASMNTALATISSQPAGFTAGLYDDENWVKTPGYQQTSPNGWYQVAGKTLRMYNQFSIAAPARDLANVLWNRSPVDTPFLNMNTLAACANYYDLVHIQSQRDLPTSPYTLPATTFNGFIDSAVAQIRGVNATVPITAGLAVFTADVAPFTNLQTMMAAAAAHTIAAGCVGWWMNFNGNNTAGVAAIQALAGI